VPEITMAKIKGHVIINGFKQTINNGVPRLSKGSVKCPDVQTLHYFSSQKIPHSKVRFFIELPLALSGSSSKNIRSPFHLTNLAPISLD
jgi:hypothetical protein